VLLLSHRRRLYVSETRIEAVGVTILYALVMYGLPLLLIVLATWTYARWVGDRPTPADPSDRS